MTTPSENLTDPQAAPALESGGPQGSGPAPDPRATRAEMLRLSARGYGQLRGILVQLSDRTLPARGSTLGRIVHARRHRALLLYVLLLTSWSWLSTRNQPLPADVWIRALTAPGGLTWTPSTLSRAWADLEELKLLEERSREGRAVRVVPRREDGAEPYDAPAGRRTREHQYFVLPDAFWKDELFAKLSLPGLAMLLIIAKETYDEKHIDMYLPLAKAPEWYGISAKTAQNGLQNLRSLGLLHVRTEQVPAPLSKTGWTTRLHYSLTGDFSATSRVALRKKARTERRARVKGAARAVPAKVKVKAKKTNKKTKVTTKSDGGTARSRRTAGSA